MPYHIEKCDTASLFVPYVANNTIYIPPDTEVAFVCKVNGTSARLNLEQWQSYGLDIGTFVETVPNVQTMIAWGRKMLQNITVAAQAIIFRGSNKIFKSTIIVMIFLFKNL